MRYSALMTNPSPPGAEPQGGVDLHASENVRAEAARRHMSARRLCQLTGITRSTWDRRMRDPRTWRLGELQTIAHVLDVPISRLANGVES